MRQLDITKQKFRHIEGLLYGYFEQPQQIENIQHHIELLKNQIQELDKRIHETDVHVITGLNMGIDYSRDKVQTSPQGSYVEMEVCRQIQKLIDRRNRKNDKINELLNEIQSINEVNTIIYDNLMLLSDENKYFIKYKYKDKILFPEIFNKTHMSRSAWFEKRRKLIENIAQWFKFVKT